MELDHRDPDKPLFGRNMATLLGPASVDGVMPTIYASGLILIKKAFFSERLTVTEISTRRKAIAPPSYVARCAYFLRIQAQLELSAEAREFVTRYIFERFGMAALYPDSLPATMFATGDPERFLVAATMAANGFGLDGERDDPFRAILGD